MLNPNKQGTSYHHQVKHLIIENSDLTTTAWFTAILLVTKQFFVRSYCLAAKMITFCLRGYLVDMNTSVYNILVLIPTSKEKGWAKMYIVLLFSSNESSGGGLACVKNESTWADLKVI